MPDSGVEAESSVAALARAAIRHGLTALAQQSSAAPDGAQTYAPDAMHVSPVGTSVPGPITALRWLERAHRLVPSDPTAALALASACLARDPSRAAPLFQGVAEKHNLRQAWLGLAAARLRLIGPDGAAEPFAVVLARFAFNPDATGLAEVIGGRPGSPGWCALRSDGTLEIHTVTPAVSDPGTRAVVSLDGQPLRGNELPATWQRCRTIDVRIGDAPLLGSPIRIATIRRLAGCVEVGDGGIRGWAWYPADPETAPVLDLRDANGCLIRRFTAHDESIAIADIGPLARPRSFNLPPGELPDRPGLLHVIGPDGNDLPGSPLDPFSDMAAHVAAARRLALFYPAAVPRALSGSGGVPIAIARSGARAAAPDSPLLRPDAPVPTEPVGADGRTRPATVVIPVHDGGTVVTACLDSVLATLPARTRVLVVDDGSSDPSVIAALEALARRRSITILRHERAQGFPAAANAGIRASAGRDVVLLNSDTLVPPGWLERLREAAYADRDIGTVTPLSNDASILSYPGPAGTNERPDLATTIRLDRVASRANGATVVDIPVGVGFCLYLRRDCLNAVGAFRADLFAQGYGEENDLCLRAHRLGWRNVALPGLFVGHVGSASFGGGAAHLRARNGRILEQLHPGYHALVQRYLAHDPLALPRRSIDLQRWRERGRKWKRSAVLITHDDGGGVEQRLIRAIGLHDQAGRRPIILRPAETADGEPAVAVRDGTADDLPNLIYAVPRELPSLLRLLRATKPEMIEAHHFADHSPAIYELVAKLGVPYDVHIHDYAWFCPRVSLVAHNRYCGEPDLLDCESCIADNGHFLKEDISVAELRRRSDAFLSAARRVVVPSDDTGLRMRRHFAGLATTTVPHEDDAAIAAASRLGGTTQRLGPVSSGLARSGVARSGLARSGLARSGLAFPLPTQSGLRPASGAFSSPSEAAGRTRPSVCVVGAIGVHKGYDILLACARDAVRRDLDLDFIVVGHTIDDARMLATGRVFVTGRFEPDEAVSLISRQNARLGFVASICPETWCLSLGDIWRAGLPAAAFDIGAPAERIHSTGLGILLPLGLSASAINNALIAAMWTAVH